MAHAERSLFAGEFPPSHPDQETDARCPNFRASRARLMDEFRKMLPGLSPKCDFLLLSWSALSAASHGDGGELGDVDGDAPGLVGGS